jgi:hypothetical protein
MVLRPYNAKEKKLETKTFFFEKIIAVSIDISKCYHFKHGFEALQPQGKKLETKKIFFEKKLSLVSRQTKLIILSMVLMPYKATTQEKEVKD